MATNNFLIKGNIHFGNGHGIPAGSEIVVSPGTDSENIQILNNVFYHIPSINGNPFELNDVIDIVVRNNLIFYQTVLLRSTVRGISFVENLIFNPSTLVSLKGQEPLDRNGQYSVNWDHNIYYTLNPLVGERFHYLDTEQGANGYIENPITFSVWRSNSLTSCSTQLFSLIRCPGYDSSRDGSIHDIAEVYPLQIILRPSMYESGKANLAVVNFAKSNSVNVDLSALHAQADDVFEIRAVQDYFVRTVDAIQGARYEPKQTIERTVTIVGGKPVVSIPMNGWGVLQPLTGRVSIPSTFPDFGVFVIVKKRTAVQPSDTVATPRFTPLPGAYQSPLEVGISTETPNSEIRYTLDGSDPTQTSTLYTLPFNIASTKTISAKAFGTGLSPSNIARATYTLSSALPLVRISSTDAQSGEGGDTANIVFSRTGSNTNALNIIYTVSGSSISGVDYQSLSGRIEIPSGQSSATLTINSIDDNIIEGDESIVISVSPDNSYIIENPSSIGIALADNEANIVFGLINYWSMDEGTSNVVKDLVGSSDGTLEGSPTHESLSKIGTGAIGFDGIDDAIRFSGISIPKIHSISLWFKPSDQMTSFYGTLFADDLGDVGLFYEKNSRKISYYQNREDHFNARALSVDTWHHLVVVNDANGLTFYIDGISDGTSTSRSGFTANSIGLRGTGSAKEAFKGSIDDVKVYNKALSASDVRSIFLITTSSDFKAPVRSGGQSSSVLPSGTISTSISLTTDEAATCRYDSRTGIVYNQMNNVFSTTGGTSHQSLISDLQNGLAYIYYIRCSDSSNNVNFDDYQIRFSVSSPVNTAPTISDITDKTINEDTTSDSISFSVRDEAVEQLTLSASSSNAALVPVSNIIFGGGGTSRTIRITPAQNQFGSSTVTLTVRDAGGLSATDSFVLTINSVNDAPTISNILDNIIFEGTNTGVISFTVGDAEGVNSLTITKASSDISLVPASNIVLGGSGTSRTVVITPAANLRGSSIITLTARDSGGLSAIDSFTVRVIPLQSLECRGAKPDISSDIIIGPFQYIQGATVTTWTYSIQAGSTTPCLWRCAKDHILSGTTCVYKPRLALGDVSLTREDSKSLKVYDSQREILLFKLRKESNADLSDLVTLSGNLRDIIIQRQDEGEGTSYIIINNAGISDILKTVYLPKLNSDSNGVCIADLDGISSKEILLASCTNLLCPGTSGSHSCIFDSSANVFEVSGLKHSGVIEKVISLPPSNPPGGNPPNDNGGGGRDDTPRQNRCGDNIARSEQCGERGLICPGGFRCATCQCVQITAAPQPPPVEQEENDSQEDSEIAINITDSQRKDVQSKITHAFYIIMTFLIVFIIALLVYLIIHFFKHRFKKEPPTNLQHQNSNSMHHVLR